MKTSIVNIVLLLSSVSISSCLSRKNAPCPTADIDVQEVAIHQAIADFSKKCNLFKKDSVFEVTFKDSVFLQAELLPTNQPHPSGVKNYTWKRGKLYPGIVAVEISPVHHPYYYSKENKQIFPSAFVCKEDFEIPAENLSDFYAQILPSRFVLKEGKLFFWHDEHFPITNETFILLQKYNLLTTSPDYSYDDIQKGADYYFCKNNLSVFKRVTTNAALGFYAPPKMNCK